LTFEFSSRQALTALRVSCVIHHVKYKATPGLAGSALEFRNNTENNPKYFDLVRGAPFPCEVEGGYITVAVDDAVVDLADVDLKLQFSIPGEASRFEVVDHFMLARETVSGVTMLRWDLSSTERRRLPVDQPEPDQPAKPSTTPEG
jgi:hypothetical protein